MIAGFTGVVKSVNTLVVIFVHFVAKKFVLRCFYYLVTIEYSICNLQFSILAGPG